MSKAAERMRERESAAAIAGLARENADLRTQLAAAELRIATVSQGLEVALKRLEAANKRMEEAEKRACLGHMREGCNYLSGCNVICNKCGHRHEPTLTFPIPPADVAELRRTVEKLREGVKTIPEYMQMVQEQRQRIAELERKLAEQQAAMAHAYVTLSACEESAEPNHGVAETVRILSKVDCTELEVLTDKAREEGRKEAIPEWMPIETAPKDGTRVLLVIDHGEWGDKVWTGLWADAWMVSYGKARTYPTNWMPLPAAPSPASLNAKEGGECQCRVTNLDGLCVNCGQEVKHD